MPGISNAAMNRAPSPSTGEAAAVQAGRAASASPPAPTASAPRRFSIVSPAIPALLLIRDGAASAQPPQPLWPAAARLLGKAHDLVRRHRNRPRDPIRELRGDARGSD